MLSSFQSWLQSPFQGSMDALHWFLFIGLIIVSFVLWGMVMKVIEG